MQETYTISHAAQGVRRHVSDRIHLGLRDPPITSLEDSVTLGVEGALSDLADPIEQELLFYYPPGEIHSPPRVSVSTPIIYSAIRELTHQLGCIPNDAQVAQRLAVRVYGYQKFREYTRGVAAGRLLARRRNRSGGKEILYLLGPEDDPLFHCVRSEMQLLLMDAAAHLADFEHLYLSFYYDEDWLSASLRVTTDVTDPLDSEVQATAYASARARIVDREHVTSCLIRHWWERDPFSPHCRLWLTDAENNIWKQGKRHLKAVLKSGLI
jgi:hypothetical protein